MQRFLPGGIALMLFLCGLLYWPGLHGSFLFDDFTNISNNPALPLFDGSLSSLISASTNGVASPLGRPLSMASFALNLHYFGPAPFSFKLANLLLHLANGVLVMILMLQALPAFMPRRRISFPAGFAAAVWLLHPINLTPVLFTVQRMTSLAAFFTLSAICLYLAGRRMNGGRGRLSIAAALLVCWPLGLLSKESAATLPLFLVLCEFFILDGFNRFSRRSVLIGAGTAALLGATLLAGAWAAVTAGYAFRHFNLAERLMTEARVLWFYVLQILLPLPDLFALHHDDIPISRSLFDPLTTVFAVGAWFLAIATALAWRRKRPLLAFGITWFLVAHLLESTVLPLEIAYEHRNYLASLGMLMWLAALLPALPLQSAGGEIASADQDPGVLTTVSAAVDERQGTAPKTDSEHGIEHGLKSSLKPGLWHGFKQLLPRLFKPTATATGIGPRLILAASFLGFCALVTGLRATQWADEYQRTTFEAGTHPDSPRANYDAGIATVDTTFLSTRGASAMAYQAAHFYFDRTARLDPRSKPAVLDLIYVDCLAGRKPTAANITELHQRLRNTPFLPGDSGLVQSLSTILVENRLCMDDTQVTALLGALLANPSGSGRMRGLINAAGMDYAAARLHDPVRALAYAHAAVAADPIDVPLRINLIHVLLASGDQLAARKEYTALLQMKISPADRGALDQLRAPVNRMN